MRGWILAFLAAVFAMPGCGSSCNGTANTGLLPWQVTQQALFDQQNTCQSNVKQLTLGLLMYSQDYDETFPLASSWMDGVAVYVRNGLAFHCPTVYAQSQSNFGYALNSTIAGVSLNQILQPSTTIAVFESTNLMKSAADPVTSFTIPGRHTPFAFLSYADGHVKKVIP